MKTNQSQSDYARFKDMQHELITAFNYAVTEATATDAHEKEVANRFRNEHITKIVEIITQQKEGGE